jgi:uncharacterized coiled-coil protein SlyX
MSDDAIIQLQEIYSYHEKDIADLSDALYTQQQEIQKLQKQVEQLQKQLKAALNASNIRHPDDEVPPPHY